MGLTDNFWLLTFKDAAANFMKDKALRLAAALAFYSIFSLTPLLLILVSLAGFFFGREEAKAELGDKIGELINPEAADTLLNLASQAHSTGNSLTASIIGGVMLFVGATGVFGQLQDALNAIWNVKATPSQGWLYMLQKRVLSFGMILVIAFLLLISLVLSAMIAAFTQMASNFLSLPPEIITSLNALISFGVIVVLFVFIFTVLPDVKIRLKNVWVGATVTAVLFVIGKFALSWYLGRDQTASAYGAAGAFIIILLWIYYSSLILFFGAEFTQAYFKRKGIKVLPSKHAVAVKVVEKEDNTAEPDNFTKNDTEKLT